HPQIQTGAGHPARLMGRSRYRKAHSFPLPAVHTLPIDNVTARRPSGRHGSMGSLVGRCYAAVVVVAVASVGARRPAESVAASLARIATARRQGQHRNEAWQGGPAGDSARLDGTALETALGARTPPE